MIPFTECFTLHDDKCFLDCEFYILHFERLEGLLPIYQYIIVIQVEDAQSGGLVLSQWRTQKIGRSYSGTQKIRASFQYLILILISFLFLT